MKDSFNSFINILCRRRSPQQTSQSTDLFWLLITLIAKGPWVDLITQRIKFTKISPLIFNLSAANFPRSVSPPPRLIDLFVLIILLIWKVFLLGKLELILLGDKFPINEYFRICFCRFYFFSNLFLLSNFFPNLSSEASGEALSNIKLIINLFLTFILCSSIISRPKLTFVEEKKMG